MADIHVEIIASGPAGPPGPAGSPGVGLAPGGSAGQLLRKKSGADYDTEWGPGVSVDAALSDTSENPVQNRAVKAALDGKQADLSPLITAANEGKVLAIRQGALTAAAVESLLPDGDEVSY